MPDFAQSVTFSLWVANTEFYDKVYWNRSQHGLDLDFSPVHENGAGIRITY